MAARRGRSQARRSGGSNGLPGWAWLVIGVLVTLLVVLMAPKLMNRNGEGGFFRLGGPQADPNAQPKGSSETDGAFEPVAGSTPKPVAKPAEKSAEFDFYELLPGEEVAMTDAQIAAIARDEARRKAAAAASTATGAAQQAADAQARAAAVAAGLPQPLPENPVSPAPATPAPTQTVASAAPAKPASQPQPAAAVDSDNALAASKPASATPYILQAGAFQASGDAESLKAKIAMLGLNARVESASINGKTMYRVRMGPYATATELADAKSKLGNGGLSAIPIKAK